MINDLTVVAMLRIAGRVMTLPYKHDYSPVTTSLTVFAISAKAL